MKTILKIDQEQKNNQIFIKISPLVKYCTEIILNAPDRTINN